MLNDPTPTPPSSGTRALGGDRRDTHSSSRRRALLGSLGGGAVGLVTPIQTLAVTTIVGGTKLCTVSGVQSTIGSQQTDTQTTCSGYAPSHYQSIANWPHYDGKNSATSTVNGITFTENSKFQYVFGAGSNSNLLTILANSVASDEAVWITALLNAIGAPASFNFPYTPAEVLAFYSGAQAAAALAFFRGYMQTVA